MKLFVLSLIFLASVQNINAQTQAAVMLATNAQVNASVLLVNLTVATQKTGLSGITEIDVRMVGNVYDSIFATESDAVNIYLTPMFTGMFNTSVLNVTYRMDAVVTPIRALLQKVRDTAYSIKRNNLVRIAARIDFFSKDITAFLNGIATTTLNKFNARTIVISKVANCQKTVFTAFNATLAQAAANMTTVARSFMTSSQSAYSSIQNYYMGVSNIFDSVVLNIPSCLDSNSIVNAWAMDWVTDAQRIGYIACIDPAIKAATTYLTAMPTTIINGLTNKLTSDSTIFFNNIDAVYQTTVTKLIPVDQAYSTCITTP